MRKLGQSFGRRKAKLPYLRYEAEEGIGRDAVLKHSTAYDETEMEASDQSYVQLTKEDSSVRFTVKKVANAMTLRFTMPEDAVGELEISVERIPSCMTSGLSILSAEYG